MKLEPSQRKNANANDTKKVEETTAANKDDKDNQDLDVVATDNEDKANKDGGAEDGQADGADGENKEGAQGQDKKQKKKKKKEEVKISCEYNLYLQDDTNADSALFQWYYFSCMNIRADTVVRINICNLSKPNGLYAKGMRPFIYSINKHKEKGIGWHRGCDNVKYFSNGHTARYSKKTLDAHFIAEPGTEPVGKTSYKQLHSLTFDYRFESDHDIVFFAHFQPYTYSDLINFLCSLKANKAHADKMRIDYICNTLGKAPMYGLTITNNIVGKYVLAGKEIFKFQKFEYKGATVKHKKVKFEKTQQEQQELDINDDNGSQSSLSNSIQSVRIQDEAIMQNNNANQQQNEATSPIGRPTTELQSMSQLTSEGRQSPDESAFKKEQPLAPKTTLQIDVKKLDAEGDEQNDDIIEETEGTQTEQQVKTEETPKLRPNKKKKPTKIVSNKTQTSMIPANNNPAAEVTKQSDMSKGAGQVANVTGGTKGNQFRRNEFVSGNHQQNTTHQGGNDQIEKIYKKTLFITSRVHPGESQASHMVHGLIEYLLSDDPEAEEIREKFVVKIIPMLNPDGVIHGNYRVGLLGVDLNRRWKKPSKYLHPTIYYTKQLIKYFNDKNKQPGCESGGVVLCCDFHGHSRNMDLFMYSCIDEISTNNMIIRSIPVGVDRQIPTFNMKLCNFALEKDKANTARIVIYKELGILSSYTLESTFYGSDFLKRPKHGSLLTREQLEYQTARYNVGYHRKDISFDHDQCLTMGADFVRGINFASKKKPLLEYWFRTPPKNIIEVVRPVPGAHGDSDIDPVLLELEKNWKPLGHVDQNKFLGVGDRFEEHEEIKLPPTPPEQKKQKGRKIDKLDIALIDKMRKQKKQRAKERKTKAQEEKKLEQLKLASQEKESLPLNNDMLDVIEGEVDTPMVSPSKVGGKKVSKRRGAAGAKQQTIVGGAAVVKRSRSRTKNEAQIVRSSNRELARQQYSGKSLNQYNSNQGGNYSMHRKSVESGSRDEQQPGGQDQLDARKVPILLREPGNTFQDEEYSEEDELEKEELRVSQLIFSKNTGLQLSQQLKQSELDHAMAAGSQQLRSPSSSEGDEEHDGGYLMSKALDSVTKSTNKNLIESQDGFSAAAKKRQRKAAEQQQFDTSSKGSGSNRKRQLNLSVRVKEGKAMFKAAAPQGTGKNGAAGEMANIEQMPRIDSQLEEMADMTDDRIESRLLISDNIMLTSNEKLHQRRGQQSDLKDQQQDLLIPHKQQSYYRQGGEEELRAMDELQQAADITFQKEQMLLNQLELTKKNIAASSQQVSADELDDLMKTDHQDSSIVQNQKMIGLSPARGSQAIFTQITPDQNMMSFKKNRLSVDPQVFPASKFEALAQVQMKTLEKEMTYQSQYQSVKSPRRSTKVNAAGKNSPGRGIFAPQNAVYNQTQLLQNPALAKAQGINFYLQEPSVNHLNNQGCINKNQHHDMLILKQQLGMNSQTSATKTIGQKQQKGTMAMVPSISIRQVGAGSKTNGETPTVLSPPQTTTFEKKASHIFQPHGSKQHKLSTAGLLNHSLTHDSSLNTIQTAVAPGALINFDQGFTINDYVNEQINLLEKTKVQVAAKKSKKAQYGSKQKKQQQQAHQSNNAGALNKNIMSGSAHPSGIILPNIVEQQNGSARIVQRSTNSSKSTKKVNSLLDLGSVGAHLTTEGAMLSHETSKEKGIVVNNQHVESITHLDGQNIEFPALSPRAIKAPSPQKRCLEMKNGFDFANNVSDRHHEKLADLKQTQTLRQRQRRMSKPQFVIKPLDPREFLNIQMQHVESRTADYRGSSSPKLQAGKVRRGGSLNRTRPPMDTRQPQHSLIKVFDSLPTPQNNPSSPVSCNHLIPTIPDHNKSFLPSAHKSSTAKRTMSTGKHGGNKYSTPVPQFSGSFKHDSLVNQTIQLPVGHQHEQFQHYQTPPPQLAKAALRKEIKQREVKSLAVRNLINQTMVVNNKLLVFKPNP